MAVSGVAQTRTRQLTLAAVFAALYFVLRSIPTFQMVGISGRFTAGDFVLTSIALICGPWSGALAVLVGTLVAYSVNPPIFFGLDFLPGLTNMVVLGLILSKHQRTAQAVYGAILVAFILSPFSLPFGYAYIPYTWLHLVAFAFLISPLAGRYVSWLAQGTYYRLVAVALLAFIGTMAQHLAGGLLYEAAAGLVGGVSPEKFWQFWRIIFWIYPIERLVIVIVSTLVAVGLLKTLRK